jgi:hypothetical protein
MEPAIGLLLAALGAAALIAAGWVGLRTRAFIRRAATTVGVVVDFAEETSQERRGDHLEIATYFYPVVQFQTASGDAVQFSSTIGTERPRLRKGQQVPVLYDPARPAEARIRSFWQLWWLPLALAFVAAVLWIVGLGLTIK